MKHRIEITAYEILNYQHWETPLHLVAKRGLPVVQKSFMLNKIDIDWQKVSRVSMWEDAITGGIIFEWEGIE